ncbi:TMV resistance protein N-like [Corylus avellana]|uniref:TMV resistance protein N-like n=1 Tax=Corylus avellana TaxID=13451 RepID=UPI00286CF06E|nr:TMV resistance protein N-like [Corylus avellana]
MANSTTNTQTAPSPPESLWEYDVFLSFRGGDTRNNFTDHLYTALRDKEIVTFRDTEGLDAGKPILELLNAIEKSRMAVVILSENYASSTWCLEELAKIIECMDAGRMRVFPIFYHVDPIHDVRLLKGTFEAAFAKHDKRSKEKKEKEDAFANHDERSKEKKEKEDAFANHDERSKEKIEKVQRWRSALRRVADLSGDHLNDEPEAQFISNFVEKVSSDKLNGTIESVYKDKYVGIKSRVEEIVNLYIDMESKDDVRFIGICGMSGIGKTTLAEAVFEMIHHQFEARSFLRDVKGRDLNDSQDQLLRDMKLKSEIPRWDERKAINTTSLRLRKKRVIIVVDDADEKGLERLAGHRDWFGPGSRIIITSEDKGLLEKRCGEKNVYQAKKLSAYDALQLFIRQAFEEPPCGRDLLDICNGFVRYVDGHPLALKILGSSMYGITNIDQWEAELERVRKSPELPKDERNIQKVLRMSYNRLSTPKKKLFLDVACFLNGEDKDRISDILEDPGKCIPEIDIKALIQKSLITVLGGKLWIHNLLQQMGWEIVNEECMERPEKRSRLWLEEDVLEVLNNGKGTDSVEGILLNAPAHKQVRLNADAFSKMKNLRLLRICTAHLPQGLNYLSNELHLLEWHEYPLKSMPRSFQPNKLVELIMPGSLIEQLPEEFSNLGKLKVINLRDSQNLIKTPDFTRLLDLERAIFQGCIRLEEVHPSIGVHKRITRLNLKDCKCLDRLPPEINLESLNTLVLSGCSRLKKFPKIGQNMTSLWELYLDRTAIGELPLSIVHLTGLSLLNLQDCNNFSSFPSVICSLTSLQTLILSAFKVQPKPNSLLIKSLSGLGSLVSLDLSDCNMGDGALPDDISCLSSLQSLNLSKNHFTCLPESISQLPKLKVLYLDNCSRLESLANIPLSTQSVMARHCTSLINYSNQIIVWTSGEPGLTFINCLNSADDIDEESKGRELSLRDIHFKPLLQRYMEGQIRQVDGMYSVSPQTEIPKWFTHQNKSGSSVPIRLPDRQDENYSSWRGIALFIVFKVKNIVPRGHDSKSFHEFIYHLDNDGGLQDYPLIIINVPKDKLYALSYGLRLYVSNARFRDHLDERGCISPSITISSSDVEIQKCGARLVYEEDMVEFVQNLTQETSGSPEHLRPRQESIEYPMNPSPSNVDEAEPSLSSGQTDLNSRKKRQPSGQSYSSPRLNRQLKSLLSLLFQGDPARYHCYEYIFPQVKMAAPPRWFNYQNVSSAIKMELPSNLNDNTRWLGFTVVILSEMAWALRSLEIFLLGHIDF